VTQLVIAVL